jgi:phospho-N-acetylmuramoyl-pentapeptide-transferase
MIELLGTWLMTYDSGFDVFSYLTVRTIGGTLTALMLSILLGPALIRFLTHIQFSQSIRGGVPDFERCDLGPSPLIDCEN